MDEKQLVSILTNFKDEIDRRIGLVEEHLQHKLDLIVEGQQMLAERTDRMEGNRRDARKAHREKRVLTFHPLVGPST